MSNAASKPGVLHARVPSVAVNTGGVAPHQHSVGMAAKVIVVGATAAPVAALGRPHSTLRLMFPQRVTDFTKGSSQETCTSQQEVTAAVPTFGTMGRTVARRSRSSAKGMAVVAVEPLQSKWWIGVPTGAAEDEPSTCLPKLLRPLLTQTWESSLSSIR